MTSRAMVGPCGIMLLAAACATTSPNAAPARSYHSAKPREALADCLLNRLGSGDFRVHREGDAAETRVRVTGFAGTYFLFTLHDASDGGTNVDMRRMNSVAPGLNNAESCI